MNAYQMLLPLALLLTACGAIDPSTQADAQPDASEPQYDAAIVDAYDAGPDTAYILGNCCHTDAGTFCCADGPTQLTFPIPLKDGGELWRWCPGEVKAGTCRVGSQCGAYPNGPPGPVWLGTCE